MVDPIRQPGISEVTYYWWRKEYGGMSDERLPRHRTDDGRAFRMLSVLDEFTRESLATRVRRKLCSTDVIDVLGSRSP